MESAKNLRAVLCALCAVYFTWTVLLDDGNVLLAQNVSESLAVGLAVDKAGTLYIADAAQIRRWIPGSAAVVVAGNGKAGASSGDGGPAVAARLSDVKGVDGTVETWVVQTGSPNVLVRQGLTREALKPGALLAVAGYPLRAGVTFDIASATDLIKTGRMLYSYDVKLP